MYLKLNRGTASHIVIAMEYYEKEKGLTEPMRYILLELKQLIREYDAR